MNMETTETETGLETNIVRQVYRTTDYDAFHLFESNRQIDEKFVETLVESMRTSDYHDAIPIVVDQDGAIIDGQHRFRARKALDRPVCYIQVDDEQFDPNDLSMLQIAEEWDADDYLHHYVQQGDAAYQRFKELRDAFGWAEVSHVRKVLCKEVCEEGDNEFRAKFQRGDLQLETGGFEHALDLLNMFDDLVDVTDSSQMYFLAGWLRFRNIFDDLNKRESNDRITYDHERLVYQINQYESSVKRIQESARIKQYEKALIYLYDHNRQKPNRLDRFFVAG